MFSHYRRVKVIFLLRLCMKVIAVVVFAGGYYQQGYQQHPQTVVVQQKPKKGGFLSGNTGKLALGQFSSLLL